MEKENVDRRDKDREKMRVREEGGERERWEEERKYFRWRNYSHSML